MNSTADTHLVFVFKQIKKTVTGKKWQISFEAMFA